MLRNVSLTVSALALVLSACTVEVSSSEDSNEKTVEAHITNVPEEVFEVRTMEVACGGCIYGMEGAEGCQLAVKDGDAMYFVDGTDVSAHELGLCDAAKQAEIAGAVEGDRFVATSFALAD